LGESYQLDDNPPVVRATLPGLVVGHVFSGRGRDREFNAFLEVLIKQSINLLGALASQLLVVFLGADAVAVSVYPKFYGEEVLFHIERPILEQFLHLRQRLDAAPAHTEVGDQEAARMADHVCDQMPLPARPFLTVRYFYLASLIPSAIRSGR